MRKDIILSLLGAVAVFMYSSRMAMERTMQHMAGEPMNTELLLTGKDVGVEGARQQALTAVNDAVKLQEFQRHGSCQLLGGKNTEYMDRQNVSPAKKVHSGSLVA